MCCLSVQLQTYVLYIVCWAKKILTICAVLLLYLQIRFQKIICIAFTNSFLYIHKRLAIIFNKNVIPIILDSFQRDF